MKYQTVGDLKHYLEQHNVPNDALLLIEDQNGGSSTYLFHGRGIRHWQDDENPEQIILYLTGFENTNTTF